MNSLLAYNSHQKGQKSNVVPQLCSHQPLLTVKSLDEVAKLAVAAIGKSNATKELVRFCDEHRDHMLPTDKREYLKKLLHSLNEEALRVEDARQMLDNL